MCWEQSRPKRTIATSRSEATTTEPQPENETTDRTQETLDPTAHLNVNLRPALAVRSHPKENRFRLTNSFRNGPLDRRAQAEVRSARSAELLRSIQLKAQRCVERLVFQHQGVVTGFNAADHSLQQMAGEKAELMGHRDGTMLAKDYAHLDRNDAHLKKALEDRFVRSALGPMNPLGRSTFFAFSDESTCYRLFEKARSALFI
jgi:hypothetical protein